MTYYRGKDFAPYEDKEDQSNSISSIDAPGHLQKIVVYNDTEGLRDKILNFLNEEEKEDEALNEICDERIKNGDSVRIEATFDGYTTYGKILDFKTFPAEKETKEEQDPVLWMINDVSKALKDAIEDDVLSETLLYTQLFGLLKEAYPFTYEEWEESQ